ncbi:hypothetical protein HMPREF0083_01156 [Aneurinibacillus aneurinilyticus ATCC 12856]|uniref:Uncharacterized protein n=1 Tax=Aneurinibacillus aneurinilyticus ATCC 12856 TaxID=649747 RepID=U1X878_ANEAE|nr:hypothetical protein HMPREF0083_01156 [Aneurinibacillus aneurinilyticus ATCC 12856]
MIKGTRHEIACKIPLLCLQKQKGVGVGFLLADESHARASFKE